MKETLRYLAAFVAVLLFAGCQTIRNGGAPPPSFDAAADGVALAQEFAGATSISQYYRTPAEGRVDARNRFMSGRLVQIDLAYLQYIRSLTADKQNLDTATELANLTLNLAGTLVGGVRAKTNLAAAATGIGGAKTTIDKEYYYEKSIDALVSTMNAKRKEVLVNILTGLSQPTIEGYPFELALTQLNEYYLAGTLNGALRFINFQAATQEKKSDDDIKNIPLLTRTTPANRDAIGLLTASLSDQNPKLTEEGARKALELLGVDISTLAPGVGPAADLLQGMVRKLPAAGADKAAQIARFTKAFKDAGIFK